MKRIEDFERLAHKVAHDLAPGHRDHDDLAQEALLVIHANLGKAQEGYEDASARYLEKVARRRVTDLLRGRAWTGAPDRNGKRPDASVVAVEPVEDAPHPADPSAERALEAVETRADLALVREAVAALRKEDRLHVFLRFWEDAEPETIASALGVAPSSVHDAWRKRIRPTLAADLADVA